MNESAQSTSTHLRGLDGLRAIAVTVVVLFHFVPGIAPGGYIGVDVFFVISGFLITRLLVAEHAAKGRIVLSQFWVRRARRLLPALALVVGVCSSVAFLIGGDVLVHLGRQVLGAATFSYNWLAIAAGSSYFDQSAPELFRNLWSLAVEEQFYLGWPLLIVALLLVRKRAWMTVPVAALAAGSAVVMVALSLSGVDATRIYFGTDSHAFGLALGAALALAVSTGAVHRASRIALPVVGSAAVLGLLFLAWWLAEGTDLAFRGGLFAVAALTGLAIVGAVSPGSWLGRVLDVAPLRWVGRRSYGIYLWHWPLIVLLTAGVPDWSREGLTLVRAGVALAVTLVLAALSYRFIEQPIRRVGFRSTLRSWRASWRGRPVRVAATAFASLAVLGLVATTTLAIVTAPTTTVVQQIVDQGQAAIDEPVPSAPVDEKPQETLPGGEQIYAIGDSVMLAASPAVKKAFPGIAIDAKVSRHMGEAIPLVTALVKKGKLRPILVIGLGTNGIVDTATLDKLTRIVGAHTEIVLINAQAPRDWIPGVNKILAAYAQSHRNVELANWHAAIQPHIDYLATDLIHAGGPKGGHIYATAIMDAIQRLAELPPLLGGNDYGLAPSPG